MAYRAKKKKIGTKIFAWFLVGVMVLSFVSTLVFLAK